MKILLCGGTGLIGRKLLESLTERNDHIILLSRNPDRMKHFEKGNVRLERWDAQTQGAWSAQINGADAVINLTGESIAAKRWTPRQKQKIVESRVHSARALAEAVAQTEKKPKVFINASAVGYYGNVGSGNVTETHPKGAGFLADTCAQWEQAAGLADRPGVRVVLARIGVVLAQEGGALSKILPPFKMFAGGPLGSGRQGFSWVHIEDVAGALRFILENSSLSGPVNLTAPNPVSMKEFCSTLGQVLRRPSWAPVPAFALKLLLGEMAGMLLEGQRVLPKKLLDAGYSFKHPDLEEALTSILHPSTISSTISV